MKHQHSDIRVQVELPTEDLSDLVDKITDSAIAIIACGTVAVILRDIFKR